MGKKLKFISSVIVASMMIILVGDKQLMGMWEHKKADVIALYKTCSSVICQYNGVNHPAARECLEQGSLLLDLYQWNLEDCNKDVECREQVRKYLKCD